MIRKFLVPMLALFVASLINVSAPRADEVRDHLEKLPPQQARAIMIRADRQMASMTAWDKARMVLDEQLSDDPMVIEHAQDLLAGKPVKLWKNCLIDKPVLNTFLNRAMHDKPLIAETNY